MVYLGFAIIWIISVVIIFIVGFTMGADYEKKKD